MKEIIKTIKQLPRYFHRGLKSIGKPEPDPKVMVSFDQVEDLRKQVFLVQQENNEFRERLRVIEGHLSIKKDALIRLANAKTVTPFVISRKQKKPFNQKRSEYKKAWWVAEKARRFQAQVNRAKEMAK